MRVELVDIAKEHHIYVFSDEVYRGLEYNHNMRLPNMADVYDRGISLGMITDAVV